MEEETLLVGAAGEPRDGGRRRIVAFAAGVSLGLLVLLGLVGNDERVGVYARGLGILGGGEGGGGGWVGVVEDGSSKAMASSLLGAASPNTLAHPLRAPELPAVGAAPNVDPLLTLNTPKCRQTRAALAKATNHDGDVVVIHELKAVYVDIVKAASEAIRSSLEDRFHASWSSDLGQYAHPIRGRPTRSSTSYLTKDIIANYTFFTFVRDPKTRFRSSYEQAICRERCTLCTVRGKGTMYTPTIPEITAFLTGRLTEFYRDLTLTGAKADEISLQEAWVDEHFESQILRLSGATPDGSPVPVNFVGRVENFEHDWEALMDHLGVEKGDERRQPPVKRQHACDIPERGVIVRQQRATPVTIQERVAVASLYHDDFECLGYPKPHI